MPVFAPPKGGELRDVPLPKARSREHAAREHGMHALRHFYASVLLCAAGRGPVRPDGGSGRAERGTGGAGR